jgi:aminomethyltransferase
LHGFEIIGRGIPREGYPIYIKDQKVGLVTSGTISPVLNHGIGLGYIPTEYAEDGVDLEIEIRGKRIPAKTKKPPFI